MLRCCNQLMLTVRRGGRRAYACTVCQRLVQLDHATGRLEVIRRGRQRSTA